MNTSIKHELEDGTITWLLLNGELHREDGPAVVYPDGTMLWCVYGHIHRTDGPAVICTDGSEEYWIEDQLYDPVTFLVKSYEYLKEACI